jgi:hypothetical protein
MAARCGQAQSGERQEIFTDEGGRDDWPNFIAYWPAPIFKRANDWAIISPIGVRRVFVQATLFEQCPRLWRAFLDSNSDRRAADNESSIRA